MTSPSASSTSASCNDTSTSASSTEVAARATSPTKPSRSSSYTEPAAPPGVASESTTTPAKRGGGRKRAKAPAVGKGGYTECPDVEVTQHDHDLWEESAKGAAVVRKALKKKQRDLNKGKSASERAPTPPIDTSASASETPASTAAVVAASSETLTVVEAENVSAVDSEDAVSGSELASGESESSSDDDDRNDPSYNETDTEITCEQPVMRVDEADEQALEAELQRLLAKCAELKKAKATGKAAATRAVNKRKADEARELLSPIKRRFSRETVSSSDDDAEAGPSTSPQINTMALVPVSRPVRRSLPEGLDPQQHQFFGLIAETIHENIMYLDRSLGTQLSTINGKVDLTLTKLHEFDDFDFRGFLASWLMAFLNDTTDEATPDDCVVIGHLGELLMTWVAANKDPKVKLWRSEHLRPDSAESFMASVSKAKKFLKDMVKDFDMRDGALVKYRYQHDHTREVLIGRKLKVPCARGGRRSRVSR
ncbi:hypothetical protein HDU88_007968 [Geranomyces variabilis]|nr:hypothetical protein HDU88_007968 [Geranomyces variabilis]